jgi:hypothetical protein
MTSKTGTSKKARSLAQLGRMLQAVGMWQLAASAYESALARDNSHPEWYYRLGQVREKARAWEEAAASYETALVRTRTGGLGQSQDAIARVCRKAHDAARSDAAGRSSETQAPLTVCFLPAPSTKKNLASARIRCAFLSDALNDHFAPLVKGSVGLSEHASAIVISQMCSATTLVAAAIAKAEGALIIYDCCDPYAEYEGIVYGLYAAQRFWDLVALADAITVPTEGMHAALRKVGVAKPIVILPDTIDYQEQLNPGLVPPTKSVVWFGNPGRGNYVTGAWALRALKDRWGQAVTLITNPANFSAPPDFHVQPWSYDGFVSQLRAHGLALVSQDPKASYKSENRYVVSIMNGVPAISTGSQSIAQLLQQGGFAEMSVADDRELDQAMQRLNDPAYRANYVSSMQRIVQGSFGPRAVGQCFVEEVLQRTLGVQIDRG